VSKIRLRRLKADQARMQQAFADHPKIRILKVKGDPPDRYQVEYRLKSLVLNGDRVVKRDRHVAEVYLTTGYPRQPPQCRMLTPLFHPNVDPSAICVGDHWAAGESLAALVVRIGEIIAYQSYNTKSPLNGEAARWCDGHRHLLPIDDADMRPESVSEAEAAKVQVAPPVPRGKLIADAPAAPRRGASGVPKARLISADGAPVPARGRRAPSGTGKILRAKKVPSRAAAADPTVVACPCGRRYRPKRPRAFRCLACGQRLTPPGVE
jgi:ubiquitin-protein ligase